MRLKKPLVRLPIAFDASLLAAEVDALPASAWTPHPSGFAGNEAVRLVTPHGEDNDTLFGPMAPTEHLLKCPYIMAVMAELGAVWGRSRLMGLGAGAEVPAHIDVNYYWRTHTRIHIPIVTNPNVEFTCGGETINMAPGECWVLDTFRSHNVANRGSERRVHLVIDTVGGERLWELIRAGEAGVEADGANAAPRADSRGELQFEQANLPKIMSAWEIKGHIAELLAETEPHPALDAIVTRLDRFTTAWAAAWARFESADAGQPIYRQLIEAVRRDLEALGADQVLLTNGRALGFVLNVIIFSGAAGRPAGSGRRADGAVPDQQRAAAAAGRH